MQTITMRTLTIDESDEYVRSSARTGNHSQTYRHPSNHGEMRLGYADLVLCGASVKWEVLNSIEMEMRRLEVFKGARVVKQEFEMIRPLEMAVHDFWLRSPTQEDVVVDATMGNGHDTLFCKLA